MEQGSYCDGEEKKKGGGLCSWYEGKETEVEEEHSRLSAALSH